RLGVKSTECSRASSSMRVGIHETGHHDGAARIDELARLHSVDFAPRRNFRDAAVFHANVDLGFRFGASVAHREKMSAANADVVQASSIQLKIDCTICEAEAR